MNTNWKKRLVLGILINVGGVAVSLAGQFRKPANQVDSWAISSGTVSYVSTNEGTLSLKNPNGNVEKYRIAERTRVENPFVKHPPTISDIKTGDEVTVYVNPQNNVVDRLVYTKESLMAAAAGSAAITSGTPTAQIPVVGSLVSVSNHDITIQKKDGDSVTFTLRTPMPVDGSEFDVTSLAPQTKVKIWTDEFGTVTRISTLPIDTEENL
jgi:hypothetical protein